MLLYVQDNDRLEHSHYVEFGINKMVIVLTGKASFKLVFGVGL